MSMSIIISLHKYEVVQLSIWLLYLLNQDARNISGFSPFYFHVHRIFSYLKRFIGEDLAVELLLVKLVISSFTNVNLLMIMLMYSLLNQT